MTKLAAEVSKIQFVFGVPTVTVVMTFVTGCSVRSETIRDSLFASRSTSSVMYKEFSDQNNTNMSDPRQWTGGF